MPTRARRAQSSVEFALLVPLIVVMFLGMLQFGLFLYGQSMVVNAARQGARAGSVDQQCPSCAAQSAATSALQDAPVIRDPSVTILAPGGVVGSTLRVRVAVSIPMIVPGGSVFGLDQILNVSAEATFRQEGW
jgi:hypothetical protein